MGDMGDWGWGWGIFGMLMMTVFWGGLILLVVYAIRGSASRGDQGTGTHSRHRDSALTILEERYARGEIDRDEFEERRRTLGDPLQPT
jgi:putative membrane protein